MYTRSIRVPAAWGLALAMTTAGVVVAQAPAGSDGPTTASRLVIAIPDDPGAPLNIWTSSQAFDPLIDLVYDKLMGPSPYVEVPRPMLAESVTQVDPRTWDVTVRDDIAWHDGVPFTADDVAFTLAYYRDGIANRYTHHTNDTPAIASVEPLGERTLRLACADPCPELGTVTLADLPILPRHVWESVTEPATHAGLPVGTGPYRLVEYVQDQYLRFVANPDHALGAPTVDELLVTVVRDQDATFAALVTGEVDVAARPVPPEQVDTLAGRDGIGVMWTHPLTAVLVRLNYERPPLDQPRFREALSRAIDRQALVDVVLLGRGRPSDRGYPHPDSGWTDPSLATPYDPATAMTLLDEMGYLDTDGDGVREMAGTPIGLDILANAAEPARVRAAQLLVAQLAAVGIGLRVRTVDAGAIRSTFGSRDFDLVLDQGHAHELADPDQFVMSSRSGLTWSARLPYPEWDPLVAAWRQTTDLEARRSAGFALQALFNRQPTAIALWYPDEAWAYRTGAYDAWAETRGYGIVNKWSFLPPETRVGMIVDTTD